MTFANKLSVEERISLAKQRTEKLVWLIVGSLQIHANNKAAIHSNKLSSQIPISYAANAFNEFARSLRFFELVRLSSLLDKPSEDRISIPTIIELIDCDNVQSTIRCDHFRYFSETALASIDNSLPYVLVEQIKLSEIDFASDLATKNAHRLTKAIKISRRIMRSPRLRAIKHIRDNYLAHSLDQSTLRAAAKVEIAKLGYEAWLLQRTVYIANAFYLAVNGVSFDWGLSWEFAERNAHALWENCKLSVVD